MDGLFEKYFDVGRIETVDVILPQILVEMPSSNVRIQTCSFMYDPQEKGLVQRTSWLTRREQPNAPSVDDIREILDMCWTELYWVEFNHIRPTDLSAYHVFIRVVGYNGSVLGGFHSQSHRKITKAFFAKGS